MEWRLALHGQEKEYLNVNIYIYLFVSTRCEAWGILVMLMMLDLRAQTREEDERRHFWR